MPARRCHRRTTGRYTGVALLLLLVAFSQSHADLLSRWNDAEFLIVAVDSFATASEVLAFHRASQDGLSTMVVAASDVYDQFGDGSPDTMAIKEFLEYAYFSWRSMPTFVLLVGNGGPGRDLLPVRSNFNTEETRSIAYDDWYSLMDDDDTPDICLARVPAWTTSQVADVVEKIIDYETITGPGAWRERAVFACTDCSGANMDLEEALHWTAVLAGDYVSAVLDTTVLRVRTVGSCGYDCDSEDAIIEEIDDGCVLVNHVGLSNESEWRFFLDLNWLLCEFDVAELAQQDSAKFPLVVNTNCETGRFDKEWTIS